MKKDLTLPVPIYQVDAFAKMAFTGNPAGVCFLTEARPDLWMQQVAAEMNLSETAFFRPLEQGDWQLRWFTPKVEVDLCGHATLATAHVIWTTDMADENEVLRFQTRSGVLSASQSQGRITLDFPSSPPRAAALPQGLEAAIGAKIEWFGMNGMDALVVLAEESQVRGLRPDMSMLARIPVRGVIVSALADAGRDYQFVSRFFAPAAGIDEDPVTGSAHCCLAPYWAERLGKKSLTGYQASERGGYVGVRLSDAAPGRVLLEGNAVTVLQGVLCVNGNGH